MTTSKRNPVAKKIRTTISLPEELLWKMRKVGVDQRISNDTLAVEAAVQEWVARGSMSEEARALHGLVDQILASGAEGSAAVLRGSLEEVWHTISDELGESRPIKAKRAK